MREEQGVACLEPAQFPGGYGSPSGDGAIVINGRFLGQNLTGVQRYAGQMLRALDARLAADPTPRFASVELHMPHDCSPPPDLRVIRPVRVGRRGGHLWEQLELSRSTRGALLVNLTNSAPLFHPRQIVTIHDAVIGVFPGNYRFAYRAWYRLLYAGLRLGPATFVTVSRFSAGEIERYFGIGRDRLRVIPNACDHLNELPADHEALRRWGLDRGGYILAVGGGSWLKNVESVEAALDLMAPPRPRLVVVGRREAHVFSRKGGTEGEGAALHLGTVTDEAMKALYERALCLVFPSFYEGFGLPPLEAMGNGCPVIVSDAASLPEVCGDAALYCDPASPASIARHVDSLRDGGPALRGRLIGLGFDRAANYGWTKSVSMLLELIEEQLGRKPASSR